MARDLLVGSTGFVGGNLAAAHDFADACHSTDIAARYGTAPELCVYAGVPAAMFLANADPAADLAVMAAARENLRRIAPRSVVLVSTIAVYPDSRGRDEDTPLDPADPALSAYGRNRLQLEAWVNPYRLQAGGVPEPGDGSLAAVHPDWVRRAGDGLYLDPAEPRVRAYIAAGVAELCAGYDIDGVHFDDYFYPTTDPAFDADAYAAYCAGADDPLPLADWRRSNVDALVALCCQTAHRYGVRFGVAPQGDPAQNRDAQYSDAARWLAEGGYVDYLMPQLYWGLEYQRGADTSHSLAELADAWLAMPRRGDVALYFGLGAYRIGAGDGGDRTGPDSEWQRGDALARQAEALAAAGGQGVGLYRYDSLFANDAFPGLAAREADALRDLWLT